MTLMIAFWSMTGLFFVSVAVGLSTCDKLKRLHEAHISVLTELYELRESREKVEMWKTAHHSIDAAYGRQREQVAKQAAEIEALKAEIAKRAQETEALRHVVKRFEAMPQLNGYEFVRVLKNASADIGKCLRMIEVARGEKSYPHIQPVQDRVNPCG